MHDAINSNTSTKIRPLEYALLMILGLAVDDSLLAPSTQSEQHAVLPIDSKTVAEGTLLRTLGQRMPFLYPSRPVVHFDVTDIIATPVSSISIHALD
jgi:hypothetical protein